MIDYTKSILLSLKTEFDKTQLTKVQNEFNKLSSVKLLDKDQLKVFKKTYSYMQEKLYEIEELKKAINEIEMFGDDKETLEELYGILASAEAEVDTIKKKNAKTSEETTKDDFKTSLAKGITKYFGDFKSELKNGFARQIKQYLGPEALANKVISLVKSGVNYVKQGFETAWKELKKIIKFNSDVTSTYNSEVYSLMQEYGVSGSQAYALQKTMDKLGYSSSDELMTALSYSQSTRDKFSKFMNMYQERYEMYDKETLSAVKKFNTQLSELKEDFQTSVMQFIADNKDTIIWAMKTGVSILQGLMNGVNGLLKIFSTEQEMSETERQSKVNDILGITSTTTNNSTNNTNNVNVNSTINYPQTDTATIKNLPQLEYEAVIKALKEA